MSRAFQLEIDDEGLATLTFDDPSRRVNVFTLEILDELLALIDRLCSETDIEVLVLLSGKPGSFIAGFDIEQIAGVTDPARAEEGSRLGHRLCRSWRQLPFPTISAIQGTCLGGGTELSLAADFLVLSDRTDVRIGLPEIRLGIVPGWGGCSRLPHRVGIAAALEMILSGRPVDPQKAVQIGLADALLPDSGFLRCVRDFARAVAHGQKPARRGRDLRSRLLEGHSPGRSLIFRQARKRVLAKTGGHYPAPLRAIEVIETAVSDGIEAGLEAEARATAELAVSPVAKNLLHVFQLMEQAKNLAPPSEPNPVRQVAVLGAGTMGGAIAQLIADRADIPVRLKDIAPAPLARGMSHAAKLLHDQIRRHRLTSTEARRKMGLLRPTLDDSGLRSTDLVIEAIVESLEIKQRVFADLAVRVGADTVLASNTSSLSIDLIARGTARPERVVGMHFFNPVERMPLVEVVRGSATSDQTLSTVIEFSRRLGKTPVIVENGPGFLVNRLLGFYMAEALWLLEDGHGVLEIDRVMTDWGMPMGPLALIDEVGVDVAIEVAGILAAAFGDRLPLPVWVDRLRGSDRLGRKGGRGFYEYTDGKRRSPDPQLLELVGLEPSKTAGSDGDLVDRLVLPMVDEAARCLDERVVDSPGDVDLAMILGTGFPPFRGGLCRWADSQDLAQAVMALDNLAANVGERYRPSAALRRAAEAGGFYAGGG